MKKYSSVFLLFLIIELILIVSHLETPKSFAQADWTLIGLDNKSISSMAVDPGNQNIVYAGTSDGHGIFKSMDHGVSWNAINNGLPPVGSVSILTIEIDPNNSNILYIGSLGPTPGIFKSIDGGANWNVLDSLSYNPFIWDIAIDPNNTNIIYVAATNGCNQVWKSIDNGANFSTAGGLPFCDPAKLLIDPNNSNIIYTSQNGVAKSLDGGNTWPIWSGTGSSLSQQQVYSLGIDAVDPNIIYAGVTSSGASIYKSIDGGISWIQLSSSPSNTSRSMITDPIRPNTLYATSNQGLPAVSRSTDGGITWENLGVLPDGIVSAMPLIAKNDPNILYEGTNLGIYVYNLKPILTPTPTPTSTPTPTFTPTPTLTPTPIPTSIPTPTPTPLAGPRISILLPINNIKVNNNTFVSILADALSKKKITKVEFYVNNSLICTDKNSFLLYTCNWKVPKEKGNTYQLSA